MNALEIQQIGKAHLAKFGVDTINRDRKYARNSYIVVFVRCYRNDFDIWASMNNSPLNLGFCPKGPPDTKTEESAAHHLYQKIIKNIL